jgi:hypothetical protein
MATVVKLSDKSIEDKIKGIAGRDNKTYKQVVEDILKVFFGNEEAGKVETLEKMVYELSNRMAWLEKKIEDKNVA